jgi:hypothetical protein
MQETENYIYVGEVDDIIFFNHVVFFGAFKKDMSHQIMNVLIHNKNLESRNKQVIIFDVRIGENVIDTTVLTHCTNTDPNKITSFEQLRSKFNKPFKIINKKHNRIIVYDYTKKLYDYTWSDFQLPNIELILPGSIERIGNFEHIFVTKPIDYLK